MTSRKATDTEQARRFVEAAREAGCDEDEATFEANLGKIARAKVKVDSRPAAKDKPE